MLVVYDEINNSFSLYLTCAIMQVFFFHITPEHHAGIGGVGVASELAEYLNIMAQCRGAARRGKRSIIILRKSFTGVRL